MKTLIIPRGASPRRYKELVESGEIQGVYRCDGKDDQVEVQQAIDSQEKVAVVKPKPPKLQYVMEGADPREKAAPKRKPRKKPATGYRLPATRTVGRIEHDR